MRAAPPKAARAAAKIFERLAKSTRFVDPDLAKRWGEIAGDDVASLARPGRLTGRGPGRSLEIVARDSAAAAEIGMRADALIERVNRFLGPGAVSRIAIRQESGGADFTDQQGQPDAEGADESGLGAALASFRNAVKTGKS